MKDVFLYISVAAVVCILTFITTLPDFDLWHRLAVGSIFFQTGSVLKQDIFSYLPTKDLWIDHEWGSGVIFYFLVNHFGEWGLFLLKALILLAIFILIIRIVRLQKNNMKPGIFYMMFAGFALLPFIATLVRCQMFTYLFFALWLYVLEKAKRGNNRLLWLLPVTMLIWVNTHGGFLAGIGLVTIYAFGELLNRKHALKYFLVLSLLIPVTLINPYGFEFWKYIIEASLMPRPYIPEWHPITLAGPFHIIAGMKIYVFAGFIVFVLLTVIAGIRMVLHKQNPDWTSIILAIVLLYLGIKHQRHAAFFVIAAAALFYHRYFEILDPLRYFIHKFLSDKYHQTWRSVSKGSGYIFLVVLLLYSFPYLSTRMTLDPSIYPVGSLEFIRQNNISGNLATTYNWGSYAFWKLYPQCKVMLDGRYEQVYPDDVFDIAMRFSENKGDWREVLKKYPADILVLCKIRFAPEDISKLAGWQTVYEDLSSVVLLPKNTIQPFYIYPDYHNPIYTREDLSRRISPDGI
ncbi:MAG: hypothetical protein QMD11_11265 [Smithella sp.]|nr:hypothetical protein [Smithella sp.]